MVRQAIRRWICCAWALSAALAVGLPAAYVVRPFDKQRLTLEALNVDSKRPERAFLNLPVRARETILQASYRFFL